MNTITRAVAVTFILVLCPVAFAGGDAVASNALVRATRSASIAGYTLDKVQRWLHDVALPKIDPDTGLYISHHRGSGRYREALWNYDDAAADTYPFLFWAAYYTDYPKIHGPVLGVLEAEQRLCNHLGRIPTALNHKTLEKVVKSKDTTIFAASEYVKDGLIPIIEIMGKDNPWFNRMRAIQDDVWAQADIETPYGMIPTRNLEANGEQIQALARLYTMTGEAKYLEWAERLADYYLLGGDFVPQRLRDHGCEIIGGLGLLLGVTSVHHPEKADAYRPHMRKMLDTILARGTNPDGLMFDTMKGGRLSDGWGYNYVSYLCFDRVAGEPVYRDRIRHTLSNLSKPQYQGYKWEGNSIDGYADSVEGALYLINRLPVPEAIAWVDGEVADHIVYTSAPDKLWTTYKLDSNGVRTALMHALMHTQGVIARPWQQGMTLGAAPDGAGGLVLVLHVTQDWSGTLVFDIPRHREYMGFRFDWPRMNTMPEWFTVEPSQRYRVQQMGAESADILTGQAMHTGLPVSLQAGARYALHITPREAPQP